MGIVEEYCDCWGEGVGTGEVTRYVELLGKSRQLLLRFWLTYGY